MAEQTAHKPQGVAPAKPKSKRVRSPNYPGLNLEDSIKRAEVLYDVEKRNAANVAVVVRHWGFNPRSSGGIVTLAALKSFGLIDDNGSGPNRQVKLSDLGFKIIIDTRIVSPERESAIREAALRPSIYSKLWARWKGELPSDENFTHVLKLEYRFNERVIEDFIRKYKETIRFAGLSDSDTVSDVAEDKHKATVGDYVQWTSQGTDQFIKPLQIKELSEDGEFVFVEGSKTGIPIEEVAKCDAPKAEEESNESGANLRLVAPVLKRPPQKPGMRNDVFTLDEGEIILQYPERMSAESYEDFKAWLDLIARKARRTIATSKEPAGEQ